MRIFLLGFLLLFSISALRAQLTSSQLQLLGHLPYDTATLAGCWHYVTDNGAEYALVGTSKGLSIVDLSNPAQPYQRFFVPGPTNNWRELKTWKGFAYVGSEAVGSGITIVDLRQLPDTIYSKVWFGDGAYEGQILKSHTLATADDCLYVFGGGTLSNGAIICSLFDPWNPQVVGTYDLNYLHDGYIRNDTLYGSEIYAGRFSVIDVTEKDNPILLATQPTPGAFNHNSWLSDNGKILYTTDEKSNAPLAAFDISNLENITLLDVYYPSPQPTKEVHNVRVLNDFLINPSYGGQLTIVDAHRPENLIETAWAVMGNSLVWDADPYLPSGIIFATAKNEGLFVYTTNYQRASYLEGLVTDASNGFLLNNVRVFVENTVNADTTNLLGQYKTGAALPGTYSVRFEKPGYQTLFLNNISLASGQVTNLDVALQPNLVTAKDVRPPENIQVMPTLFSDQLRVALPKNSPLLQSATRILIFDLQGKMVYDTPVQGLETRIAALDRLPAGQYILFVQSKDAVSFPVRIVKSGL